MCDKLPAYLIISIISALKSVTNYLLVNLSIADLLITWLCVPLQANKCCWWLQWLSRLWWRWSSTHLFRGFFIALKFFSSQMTVLSLRWFPFGKALCHFVRLFKTFMNSGGANNDHNEDFNISSLVQPAAICASSFTLVAICSERWKCPLVVIAIVTST